MRFFYILFIALLVSTVTTYAVTHTVTDSGLNFSPAALTINLGDTVDFSLASMHNVIEVEQSTYNSNGNTPKTGGFSLPFGGGILVIGSVGTYYYVCSPHASSGMKGTITVVDASISTSAITQTDFCRGDAVQISFTVTGSFGSSNVFTAELSDELGSFGTPTSIGSLSGTSSGQINATIPAAATVGTAYRIRVVASDPVVIGSDNGADLSIYASPPSTLTAAGATTFCEGLSVQLDAPGGAGLSYVWYRNGTVIFGTSGSSFTATLSGSYSVEISNAACMTVSNTITVTVNPANPTSFQWMAAVDQDWSTVGNWDSPCATPGTGDTVTIGPGAMPPAQVPAMSLSVLTLDNSLGLTLGGNLEITSRLTMTDGTISLGNADLNITATAEIASASSSAFIVTDGNGRLRQANIGSGARTGTILFPVGHSAGSYTPLQINNTGVADVFSVGVRDEVLTDGTSGTPLLQHVVGKTWDISEDVAGSSNTTLTFFWNPADELQSFDATNCYIARYDGNDWDPLQTPGTAMGPPPYQRSVTGVTAFSPFAIGDGNSPLPVEYRSLSAEAYPDAVILRWETARETNNRGFIVERRTEATSAWRSLGFVEGLGETHASHAYEYADRPPTEGVWLYRLRQLDTDGRQSLSPTLHVAWNLSADAAGLAIESSWPNPVPPSEAGTIAVRFRAGSDAAVRLGLYNMLGQKVAGIYDGFLTGNSAMTVRFDATALSPGIYLYRLEQGGHTVHHRLLLLR
ncbi:MAG: T9SS type A sorting domain-containing protein [Bacteroidetes bacterium]|nr:T9SS type A sorting domain-containing protein [Bacteroidota bacterium]